MTTSFKQKGLQNASHQSQACNCNHCMGIRRQQQESELKWLREHQLFDR
ncbi:hypothetical protein [Prochlorococcus sp. MIT 1223]|nr:hypothetical protein [Prochlorococcus sp. MIT 1223]